MTGEFVRVLEGGVVSDIVPVPGKAAVACQLGGEDGRTLFCLTYKGTIEDLHQGKVASKPCGLIRQRQVHPKR